MGSGAENWDTLWLYQKAGSFGVLDAARKTLTIQVKEDFGQQPMTFFVNVDAFRSWAEGSMFPYREASSEYISGRRVRRRRK